MPQKIRSKNTDFGLDTDAIKVPVGTSNQRETVETGALRFNSTTGKLEVFDGVSFQSVGIEAPVIDSVTPTNVSLLDGSTGSVTFTITGSNFTAGSTAVLLTNLGAEVSFSSVTRINDTELQCTIALSSLSNNNEPYGVKVTNGSGLTATIVSQINVDAQPVFITAAGSLGTFEDGQRTGISLTVVATDPESAGTVTYELISGSLPAGLSSSDSSGVFTISGNADSVANDTTSSFTIRAKDTASNTSTRSFSIRINAVKLATFNSPGTFTVPTGVTSVEVLVVGGGGNLGNGGGGGGGLVYTTSFPVSPGTSIPVSIGSGGSGGQPAPPSGVLRGAPGTNTTFSTITALGGGGGGGPGGQSNVQLTGLPGGSGGGGGGEGGSPGNYAGGSATQGPSGGAPGFGNPGGTGLGNTGNSPNQGGGGGGAGAAGGSSNSVQGDRGQGGDGRTYTISGSPVGYAGGSGGSQTSTAFGNNVSTGVATANRGGGGYGTGAPGVVIIAWT